MSSDVSIVSGNLRIGGWKDVVVTASIEGMRGFAIGFTDRLRDLVPQPEVMLQPGDDIIVYAGDAKLLTGYVNTYDRSNGPDEHSVRMGGRSKTQDLIDCTAQWPGNQFTNSNAYDIAANLSKPFGIDVICPIDARTLPLMPLYSINLGETAFNVIEQVARTAALLVTDDEFGRLVLTQGGIVTSFKPGQKPMTGRSVVFKEGVNVERSSVHTSDVQRFSHYQCYAPSRDVLKGYGDEPVLARREDPAIKRFRPHLIIGESTDDAAKFFERRLNWEANRRLAQSTVVELTTDSWTDATGVLYAPNQLATVMLPSLRLSGPLQMLISEVTYRLDESGTHAELTLMNPAAFQPAPAAPIAPLKDSAATGGVFGAGSRQNAPSGPLTPGLTGLGGESNPITKF